MENIASDLLGKKNRMMDKFRILMLQESMVSYQPLTLSLQVSSADNLGKQFGPRSGPTNRRA